MSMKKLFTSESVTEGHPDKLCDQVSDGILDAVLAQDPMARVACETCTTTGMVMVMGEMTTNTYVDVEQVVRDTVKKIGYDGSGDSFDYKNCAVLTAIHGQSPDIAMGVDSALENRAGTQDAYDLIGAGDQGMMFGYASDETDVLMPMPIYLAQNMSLRLSQVRKDGTLPYLRPDGKTQVTVRYEDDRPVEATAVVVSTQHAEDVELEQIRHDMVDHVIAPVLDGVGIAWANADIYVNPTGRFVVGGPVGDTGLTGRKIIVDTYGGMGRHGGGAFSGKDATKVDRSGAYAARWVAKNVVAAGLAKKCEVELAYAIGVTKPLSVMVDTFGTGTVDDSVLDAAVNKVFDLRPGAIIRDLDLRRPIFSKTSAYGHFGRNDPDFTWEATNRVDELKAAVAELSE